MLICQIEVRRNQIICIYKCVWKHILTWSKCQLQLNFENIRFGVESIWVLWWIWDQFEFYQYGSHPYSWKLINADSDELSHLTQVLSGHGYFKKYLHRIRIKAGPAYSHCTHGRNDGSQHTLFECEAWQCQREELHRSLGEIGIYEKLEPGTLVPIMLKTPRACNLVTAFASKVIKIKIEVEWRRQRAERRSQRTSQVPSRAVGRGL